MGKKLLLIVLILFSFVSIFALAQDSEPMDCDTYVQYLEGQLNGLNNRLGSFVNAPSALRSDYVAWQERRIWWQELDPPECAQELHADVIAMYANLGDISAYGLWLKLEPDSASGIRLAQEAIERTETSILSLVDKLSEIAEIDVDTDSISESLAEISVQLSAG
jgi:hypothetical protein